jgi:hypothetical protein
MAEIRSLITISNSNKRLRVIMDTGSGAVYRPR